MGLWVFQGPGSPRPKTLKPCSPQQGEDVPDPTSQLLSSHCLTEHLLVLRFLYGVPLPANKHPHLTTKYKGNSFLSSMQGVQKGNAVDIPCFLTKTVSLLKWITWLRWALRMQRIPLCIPVSLLPCAVLPPHTSPTRNSLILLMTGCKKE